MINLMIRVFCRKIQILDDELTIMRIPGDDTDIRYDFIWKNFKLYNKTGNEILLDDK